MTAPRPARRYCVACGSDEVTARLIHHAYCAACGITDWRNPLPVAGTFIVREHPRGNNSVSATSASASDPLPFYGEGLGWGTAPLAQNDPPIPHDMQVLLVRRAAHMDRGAGGWVFPGGFVERGETPWQGAVRETQEEALVTPRILRVLPPRTVLDPHHVVMPFLAALDPSEEPRPGPECSEVRWFALDEILWDDIPFSTTVAALRGIAEAEPLSAHGIEAFREVPAPGRSRAPFRFCVRCRAALGAPGEDGAVRCPSCRWVRWDNPSPTAGFVPIQDRRVLRGRRRQGQDGGGRWAFPSGHMEPGETPEETAQRELLEESGVTARAERFVGLFASGDHHEALYTGPILDTSGAPSGEFETLEWFTGPEAAALDGHHGTPDLITWARREGLLD